MRVETLMVHLDTSAEAERRLALAASLARSTGAALIGVAAGRTAPLSRESSALLAEAREVEELLDQAGERFAQVAANLDVADWRSEYTDPVAFLNLNARVADVVIVGPLPPQGPELTALSLDPEEALVGAGRPVLYSPGGLEAWRGERALVAWKDCKEARRALYEALPFLAQAQEVAVAAFTEDEGDEGLDDVVSWLESHGVTAVPYVEQARFGGIGQALIQHAQEIGADYIVAGAFSRTRGQERVFGGVTVDLLRMSPVPVLFAH